MRIGIIGGTGIGERLASALGASSIAHRAVTTPFGDPSGPIGVITLGDDEILLLERHAPGHRIPPHRVPYRANVFALKAAGVTHLLATGACGSLREDIEPGSIVLPDQIVDRTTGRDATFFDDLAVHVEMADPVCPALRRWLAALGDDRVRDGATYVTINGPSFSTRAESLAHRAQGFDVVGMTAMPEARLAREAEIAYALIALPTDHDCWRPRDPSRSEDSILRDIRANLSRAGDAALALIRAAIEARGDLRTMVSPAHTALDHAVWSDPAHIDNATRQRLAPLLSRVID